MACICVITVRQDDDIRPFAQKKRLEACDVHRRLCQVFLFIFFQVKKGQARIWYSEETAAAPLLPLSSGCLYLASWRRAVTVLHATAGPYNANLYLVSILPK
jgi:hypothetical protein